MPIEVDTGSLARTSVAGPDQVAPGQRLKAKLCNQHVKAILLTGRFTEVLEHTRQSR